MDGDTPTLVLDSSLKPELVAADLFARLIISAKSRDINLKEVLSYELSTVPHSLAHADGTLRKTTKSALLTELEKEVDVQLKLPGKLTELQLHT